jgi:hypothetical protein
MYELQNRSTAASLHQQFASPGLTTQATFGLAKRYLPPNIMNNLKNNDL